VNNDWFNIRFGATHLHIVRGGHIWFSHNEYHEKQNREKNWKWFCVYTWFGKSL
jgi:hypothetical protein